MTDFLSDIGDLLGVISQGLTDFVKFIVELPTLFYNFITLLPNPLSIVVETFVSFLIIILLLKVVRLIVG